uniref:Gustatory receptor n=1 Tax=Holotrichia parallela TaxID=93412 RepID=A0A2P9JYB9_HOLPA|nr:gustatory receptor 12 [Holotrichia parallela]
MIKKMNNSEDIYNTILPIYVISKILGLAPFKMTKKVFVIQCGPIVPLRIFIVTGIMCYIAVELEKKEYATGIAALALKCELYLGIFMTFAVLILAVINQKDLMGVITKLVDIDENMRRIHIKINHKNSRRFVLIQMIFISCVFLIKLMLQYFSHTSTMIVIYSAFNFVDYINTIMLFQYVNLLLLIRQRFIWVNRKLKSISNFSYPICVGENKVTLTPIQIVKHKSFLFDARLQLEVLAKIYSKLCDISRLTNWTYNIQILITVTSRFVMITTQLINTYNAIRDPRRGSYIEYSVMSTYLALHLSKIFMVASVSENTAYTARHTAIYLHNAWEIVPDLRNEIQYFSLQILHQNLSFTGCGFFALDYTLIYNIVGAIATYFIIVIQLEKAF